MVFMSKRFIYIISLAVLFIVISIIVVNQLLLYFGRQFLQGETHRELSREVTFELLDSAHIGLERYKQKHGYYPEIEGKYFFDSIKTEVGKFECYVYADSIIISDSLGMGDDNLYKTYDYRKIGYTYLGVRQPQEYITYKRIGNGYKLYSIGQNEIDENGEGDDVVYKLWMRLK